MTAAASPGPTPASLTPAQASPATAAVMAREDRWQVPSYAKLPLALASGEGCWVTDVDGRRYLDLYGGHCVALLGHCHPRLVAALRDQAGALIFYSNVVYSPVRAAAAEKVTALAPEGLRRVFFCNSGTEANETALKLARKATGRRVVVSMQEGFHGRTLGSLGATGPERFRDPSWPVPTEHRRVPFGDEAALAAAMDDDVAAVITEPVLSMGGVRVADEAWYAALRAQCDAHGALLVFDEVQTGFGRTGSWFFGEQVGMTPDLISAAKGVAGGVPAGLVLVREDLAEQVQPGDQGSTFGGGPLACAALAAVCDVLTEQRLHEHAARLGAWLAQALCELPGVGSVSGRGLLLGVNLERAAGPVVAALRARGLLTGGSADPRQLRLMPPLILQREQAALLVTALGEVLSESPA
ncbi:MAG: aspartate aminotransferase family protein [Planctomycetota bacterium]|nr:MAG: aspartate aminotransferase family protein [Planctomycetota bacterium]